MNIHINLVHPGLLVQFGGQDMAGAIYRRNHARVIPFIRTAFWNLLPNVSSILQENIT